MHGHQRRWIMSAHGSQCVLWDFSMRPMRWFMESEWICTDFPVFSFASVLASPVWSPTIYNRCFWLMHCNDMEATFLCNSAHTYYHFIFPQNQLLHSLARVLKKKFDGGEVATGSSLDLQSCEVEMLQTSIGTLDIYNPVGRLGGNSHRSADSRGYRRRRRWWCYEWWAELGRHGTQFCPVCVSTKGPSIK